MLLLGFTGVSLESNGQCLWLEEEDGERSAPF